MMAAMTSLYAEKCRHLASKHKASVHVPVPDLLYIRTCLAYIMPYCVV